MPGNRRTTITDNEIVEWSELAAQACQVHRAIDHYLRGLNNALLACIPLLRTIASVQKSVPA
jgi:hypothetical protein